MTTTSGRRRHFLPASAIGHFSSETSGRLRERKVWVLPKSGAPRLAKAGRVGYGLGIYGHGKGPLFDHDALFAGPEQGVSKPVDNIINANGSYDLSDWSKVAAYVASQFARGPDLEEEVLKTVQAKGWNPNRVAVGYPLNFQRVAAAVLRASWKFVYTKDDEYILGDRAITGLYLADSKSFGYFIPFRKKFGLLIGQPEEKAIVWKNKKWLIKISAQATSHETSDYLNKMSWLSCRKEAYASSNDLLERIRNASDSAPIEIIKLAQAYEAASLIKLSAKRRMDDEMLIYKLLGGLQPPNNPNMTLKV